ncbi:hypothetical protein ACK2F5_08635 [Clostridioides difficile]
MKEEILIEKLLRVELIVMEYLWKKDTLMPKKNCKRNKTDLWMA